MQRVSGVIYVLVLHVATSATGPATAEQIDRLPVLTDEVAQPVKTDWLVVPSDRPAGVYRGKRPDEIVMTNGLISRTWRVRPNAATVAYDNLMTGDPMLRGVKPEAMLRLDGENHNVGGLVGQVEYAYLLPEWIDSMTSDPAAFQFTGFEVGSTEPTLRWKRRRYAPDSPWPPKGVSLTLDFRPPGEAHAGLIVSVHYEMYDGIPLLAKWLTIRNDGAAPVRLDTFTSEILAAVEYEAAEDQSAPNQWMTPNIHVASDYAFGSSPEVVVHWAPDPQYLTQIDWGRKNPCLLECRPPIGPDVEIAPRATFESFRTYELAYDGTERERKSLSLRRMHRTLAPWALENPILMHVSSAAPEAVRLAVDQCAEVGFEMVILTFGSGLDMEDVSPANLARMKELADYAHSKGIELGGYSLLASRKISDADDAINPETGKPGGMQFGDSPCLGSPWGVRYFENLRTFLEQTGFDLLEHDGSYPGDVCASTRHPGHRGLNDSQWTQWRAITRFYQWCRERGVYLNVPDWYFLSGASKTPMGYREDNWSLPRERQILLARQNIYDGTWNKTPSMGWMFLPLVQYHGGGEAATIEPLAKHLDVYQAQLATNFGAGVQSCYRGPRLYDTDETKAVVKKWVDFYKARRAILDSDVIHVRRPDGRDIDAIMHVNPRLKEKALLMVYNPLDREVDKTLDVSLYYAGLTETAEIREKDGPSRQYKLDRKYRVSIPIKLAPRDRTWFVVE
jgi:hypothetical protein